jgi:hypothetical protein
MNKDKEEIFLNNHCSDILNAQTDTVNARLCDKLVRLAALNHQVYSNIPSGRTDKHPPQTDGRSLPPDTSQGKQTPSLDVSGKKTILILGTTPCTTAGSWDLAGVLEASGTG